MRPFGREGNLDGVTALDAAGRVEAGHEYRVLHAPRRGSIPRKGRSSRLERFRRARSSFVVS